MRIPRLIVFLLSAMTFICTQAAVNVNEYTLNYRSVNQRGDSLSLSGKVTVPQKRNIKGIILIPHYTICAIQESPSIRPVRSSHEANLFYKDYVLVLPDYIGYGGTKDSIHPYLHGELTAQNCVDMYLSAQRFLDSLQTDIPTDSLYVVGFSQGGAAALWTLRLIEEHYAGQLFVKGCFAGSGPYDVATTYDDAVVRNDAGVPVTIPMLVVGTSVAYDLNLHNEYFFTPELIKVYDSSIAFKQTTMLSLYFKMLNSKLSYWMTVEGRDKSQPETQRLYEGLLRSSLVHYPLDEHPLGQQVICPEWRPKTPTYIFHSTKDDVVCFHNAEHLQRCFGDTPNVRYDFGNYGGHLRSMNTFFLRVHNILNHSF